MDYAREIKSKLSAKEVFIRYGFELNRAGAVCCPFHNEKTPSLKVYDGDRGWHCFGCHKGGDVIRFVQEYFGLTFPDAIAKMNEDFSLGLPIGERRSERHRLAELKAQYVRQKEKERREAEWQKLDDEYWTAFEKWLECERDIREFRPQDMQEDFNSIFAEALKNRAVLKYNLENAEIRRSVWKY